MVSQPVCAGLLVGLVLGNPHDGFLAGSVLQMLFLGMVPVRGAPLPDLVLGGVSAPVLFILSQARGNAEPSARGFLLLLSLAGALLVALVGQAAYRFWESRSSLLAEAAARCVEKGRFRLASALHFSSLAVHFAFGFAVTVLVATALVPGVAGAAGLLAGKWSDPLAHLSVLLPFVGAGSLLVLHLARVRLFMFLAGFGVVFLIMFFRG